MTAEQIGLYQAVLDTLVVSTDPAEGTEPRKGQIFAAITALKQICNHPSAYQRDNSPRGPMAKDSYRQRLSRRCRSPALVFAAGEKVIVFTHFAEWGQRLAEHLTETTGACACCPPRQAPRA